MVGRQIIVAETLKGKGKLSRTMMRNLLVRGSGLQVDDTLQRHGWSSESPVATSVITLEETSGAIRGIRYETRGQGPVIAFKARELWPGADERVSIKIKFSDLSRLVWVTEGESRNQTSWLDSSEVELEVEHEEEGLLTPDDYEGVRMGGFSVRFTLLPVQVDKAFLYGGIIPISKSELEERLRDLDTSSVSPRIPTIAMKLDNVRGMLRNGLAVDLLPKEQEDNGVGLGHFPLLESIGSVNPMFPSHENIGEELAKFLRGTNPTNNMKPARLQSMLQSGDLLSGTMSGTISFQWPAFQREGASTGRVETTGL